MERPLITQQAIDAAGGVTALARALGINPEAVSQWRKIPVQRVPAVSAITGIPRHALCPKLWGPEPGDAEGEAA